MDKDLTAEQKAALDFDTTLREVYAEGERRGVLFHPDIAEYIARVPAPYRLRELTEQVKKVKGIGL